MKKSNAYIAVAIAAVVILIIRLTVFTDDCNLLIVAATFALTTALTYLLVALIRR